MRKGIMLFFVLGVLILSIPFGDAMASGDDQPTNQGGNTVTVGNMTVSYPNGAIVGENEGVTLILLADYNATLTLEAVDAADAPITAYIETGGILGVMNAIIENYGATEIPELPKIIEFLDGKAAFSVFLVPLDEGLFTLRLYMFSDGAYNYSILTAVHQDYLEAYDSWIDQILERLVLPADENPETTGSAVPTLNKDFLAGTWISERMPDGSYWILELLWPDYMAQVVVFHTGDHVPTEDELPVLWSSGAWENLYGETYNGDWRLEGDQLTFTHFEMGEAYSIKAVGEDIIFLDDGSEYPVFQNMWRIAAP